MCVSKYEIWQQAYQQYCSEVQHPLPYTTWLINMHHNYHQLQQHRVVINTLNDVIGRLSQLIGNMFHC